MATETSFSIEDSNITKVRTSADAIKKVFPDSEVHAALYCENISDSLKTIAERLEVNVVRRNA